MHNRKFARAGGPLALLIALGCLTLRLASAEWLVPGAELRFTVELTREPLPAQSGYVVHLPDGGILPGKFPVPAVFALSGEEGAAAPKAGSAELESSLLWHNQVTGASIVFADPGAGVDRVHLYVSGSSSPRLWTPESRLKPSALLCAEASPKADLKSARDLARLGTVGPTAHVLNKSGIPIAPLSIGGDESGRPRPAAFYLLSHVITSDPGKTWIAPFTIDGETLVLVNGKELKLENRIDKWGGIGAWFDLNEGLNRIEVFQTAPGAGDYGSERRDGGLMYLTWRTPHATLEELGGARSSKVPMSGTSRMETRVLKFEEIARSGDGRVERIESKTGTPVACARIRPARVFWFAEESPLVVCSLEAVEDGNPKDTVYTWDLGTGGTVEGGKTSWVFPGLREHPVKLTARTSQGGSVSATRFFAYAPLSTDLSDPAAREDFRNALTGMVQARLSGPDPVRDWDPAIWNNLIRTLELGQGYDLLHNLVTQRRNMLRQLLPPAQLTAIQDVYLDMLQQRDPKQALELVDAIGRESSGERLEHLLIRKFEIQMHYLGARAEAEAGLKRLADNASGEIKEWAAIRLGDAAFLAGDLNKATSWYAPVQNRVRARRNLGGATPLDKLVTEELLPEESRSAPPPEPVPGGKKRKRDQPQPEETVPPEPAPPTVDSGPGPAPGNWGVDALLDVNLSENVSNLIQNGFYLEAKEALRAWERKFPMSKIGGDYVLQEARFYMALRDWRRARAVLEAYCRAVDASSFLPETTRMLVQCAREMKTPPGEIREVIEAVKGNLQFHPVAQELEAYLSGN